MNIFGSLKSVCLSFVVLGMNLAVQTLESNNYKILSKKFQHCPTNPSRVCQNDSLSRVNFVVPALRRCAEHSFNQSIIQIKIYNPGSGFNPFHPDNGFNPSIRI